MSVIDAADVQALVLDELGFLATATNNVGKAVKLPSDSALSIRGEMLRASLWALSNEGQTPVYVTRLLHVAGPVAASAVHDGDGDYDTETGINPLAQALEELEAIGDIAALPRGYWLPAPLRCVPLSEIRRWVLLGGLPKRHLPVSLSARLEHVGVARLLTVDPNELGVSIPIQEQGDWTKTPSEPVAIWTQGVMESAKLSPFDDADAEFDCYVPRAGKFGTQYHRWTGSLGILQDKRYLARQRIRRGPTTYAVVELRSGRVVAAGSPQFEEGDIRRLLYGLDSLAGRPIRIRMSRRNPATWRVELKSELPRSELRLFTVLGQLHMPGNGAFYPRHWELAERYAAQAAHALRRLDVQLEGADELGGALNT